MTTTNDNDRVKDQLRQLGLWGVLGNYDQVAGEPWLPILLKMEGQSRHQRSLERRFKNARLGTFKPIADFDWTWPKKVDRAAFDELFKLNFVSESVNVILLGPNGIGKTMLAKNLVHHAVVRGHTALFTTASDMLSDLAAQETNTSLSRRLRRYCTPKVLGIDEVGYLSYDARYADLLFEVVTRRYNDGRPIVLTTNKPFAEWTEVFPNAGCVVTLVDRFIHRSEVLAFEGKSYRLKEAQENAKKRQQQRKKKTIKRPTSSKR